MEIPPNLPDDASMSDLTMPDTPRAVDPGDPVNVGASAEEHAADDPIARDDPSTVGAPTDTDATESTDDAAEGLDTGGTAGSEMGGDRL